MGSLGMDHRALNFTIGLVWLASLVSLWPVKVLGPKGIIPTVWGYFLGAAVRLLLCLIASVWAVTRFGLHEHQVMVMLVVAYLPLLFVEAAWVGRYLWLKDGLLDPTANNPEVLR